MDLITFFYMLVFLSTLCKEKPKPHTAFPALMILMWVLQYLVFSLSLSSWNSMIISGSQLFVLQPLSFQENTENPNAKRSKVTIKQQQKQCRNGSSECYCGFYGGLLKACNGNTLNIISLDRSAWNANCHQVSHY